MGQRTTAWLLVDACTNPGFPAELIGTGQTAWLRGAKYSIVLDSPVNDFFAGEIEHAVRLCEGYLHPTGHPGLGFDLE